MTDDDFTSRIRAARPTLPRRGEDLSPRAEALLDSIMDTAEDTAAVTPITTAPKRARFRPLYLAAAAALIIVVVSVVLIAVPRPSPSWAVTPLPLAAKPIDGTAKELMMRLNESIRAAGGSAPNVVRSQSWSLAFTPENEQVPVVVAPEVREFTRHPDGSVVIDIRAGTPYDAAGNEVPDAGVEPGTVIWRLEEAPGEHVFLFPAPAPSIAAEYPAYLTAANPADTDVSAGDYFLAIRLLLDEQALTAEQEAALVQFLATLPGITVDGEVVDRLGRAGIAFSTETRLPGQFRDTLVISPDAGVLSYEVTYLAGDRTDIQAPAVTDYAAWE